MGGVWTPADQARRRRLVRHRRPVARPRDEVHERVGLHAHAVARTTAGLKVEPHRLRARRPPRRAVRARLQNPARGQDGRRHGRRALGADVALPVGVDDAQRRATSTSTTPASYGGGRLVFRDAGTPPRNAEPHDWAAVVGSNAAATRRRRPAPGHCGPQGRPRLRRSGRPPRCQLFCDDGPFGKGTGGQLRYRVTLPASGARTLWIAVAGSDTGRGRRARRARTPRSRDPDGALAEKVAARERLSQHTQLSLPGRPAAGRGHRLGQAEPGRPRRRRADGPARSATSTRAGTTRRPSARCAHARWIGAGYPDYPWIFATDAEYTAFAAVALGQFEAIKDHVRALRDVSVMLNGAPARWRTRSSTTARCTSAASTRRRATPTRPRSSRASSRCLALDRRRRLPRRPLSVRRAQHALRRRAARRRRRRLARGARQRRAARAWARRSSTTPSTTIRGLYDLADMARSKGDGATATLGGAKARATSLRRFEAAWWMPERPAIRRLAEATRATSKIQQKHWIGVTPMEAELYVDGRARARACAPLEHGDAALAGRERRRASPASARTTAASSTRAAAAAPTGAGERTIFALNTAIQAVGEGNYGRLGATSRSATPTPTSSRCSASLPATGRRRTSSPAPCRRSSRRRTSTAGARHEHRPLLDAAARWSCRRGATTARRGRSCTSSSACGPTWAAATSPSSRSCRRRSPIAGSNIRLGDGRAGRSSRRRASGTRYTTTVDTGARRSTRSTIGHTLPRGSQVGAVTLDGTRWLRARRPTAASRSRPTTPAAHVVVTAGRRGDVNGAGRGGPATVNHAVRSLASGRAIAPRCRGRTRCARSR